MMADHCRDISSRLHSASAYVSVRSNRHPALLYLSHEEPSRRNVLETTARRRSPAPPQRFLPSIVLSTYLLLLHLCTTRTHSQQIMWFVSGSACQCGVGNGGRPVGIACCRGVVGAVRVKAHVSCSLLWCSFPAPSFRCGFS